MKQSLAAVLLLVGSGLAACTPAPRTAQQSTDGTSAGSAGDPLSMAAQARAGAGCPDASAGIASIRGTTGGGHPDVTYAGRAPGPGAGDPSRRLEAGGDRGGNSCN